ncbi:MAG: hypothetical protein R3C02_07845 [Planctomycetaceae bacterium]
MAEILLQCICRLERPDAVPIGLAAGVVYHPSAIGKLEKATGKLEERFLSGKSPEADHMQRWSAAATEAVRALRHTEAKTYRQTIQRADEILKEIQADGMAYLSDTSPRGFDQRLARVGGVWQTYWKETLGTFWTGYTMPVSRLGVTISRRRDTAFGTGRYGPATGALAGQAASDSPR